ncbi:MAG: hypothetical protein SCK28_07830 [Bacillota bacterium]|nr:hypothetical protein [Bacillota bacterium]
MKENKVIIKKIQGREEVFNLFALATQKIIDENDGVEGESIGSTRLH